MGITQGAFDTLGSISEATIMMDDSLYEYFFKLIETQSSSEVLHKIRLLLVDTENYPDFEVKEMVKNLVYSPTAKTNCLSFFNRLCQVCMASWMFSEETRPAIFYLLELFKETNIYQIEQQKFIIRWQEEIRGFSETNEYIKLIRLMRIISPRTTSNTSKPTVLGDLLGRYPFLYKDCLLNNYSIQGYIDFLAGFKQRQQRCFNTKLNRTIILQKQKIEVARIRALTTKVSQPIPTVPNPTLLNSQAFNIAIETFTKVTNNHINNKESSNFLTQIESLACKEFKTWLIDYFIKDIQGEKQKIQLAQYLTKHIEINMSNFHHKSINEFLILRISKQLLNKLIFNPSQPSNRIDFMNLKNSLGSTQLTVVLLKLTFLNPKLKYSLRQRLAHLFNYYESTSIEETLWLIQVLENCLLAFAIVQEKGTIV